MSLEIKNLSFGYGIKPVLSDISVRIATGEFLSIVGPNGTGKTTFLKCVNQIISPQAGRILYDAQDITNWNRKAIARIIAYVPQHTQALMPMTVIDTVLMGRLPYAQGSYSAADKACVFSILQRMDLEKIAFSDVQKISGGERQKVFIARALAQQSKAIILDEPTGNLDLKNQLQILKIITEICRAEKLIVMMSIHDLNLAAMFSDKILMLKDGKIFAHGSPERVITQANIAAVYGVNTSVTTVDDHQHVRLLKA